MPKKFLRRSLFGKKDAFINSANTPGKTISNWYRSIDKLPLSKFIDCDVDGNIFALVISGIPEYEELQEAWRNISLECTDENEKAEFKMYRSLYAQVSELEFKYNQLESLVGKEGILKLAYSRFLCGELNRLLGTNIVFNYKDESEYQEQLLKCERRSKAVKMRYDLKLMEFSAIHEKFEKKGVATKRDRRYYSSMLIALSDHAKYPVTDSITTLEYFQRIKRYNEYCEIQNSKK